jgi:hypothetical protein
MERACFAALQLFKRKFNALMGLQSIRSQCCAIQEPLMMQNLTSAKPNQLRRAEHNTFLAIAGADRRFGSKFRLRISGALQGSAAKQRVCYEQSLIGNSSGGTTSIHSDS